ncbi:MAG: hypothetical protein ABEJ03_00715 [Candidatus Nanohaloarchaea archaeon]
MLEEKLSEKQRKILAATGIVLVLGSWLVIPIAAKVFYDISSIEIGFFLTLFWVGVWSLNVLRKKYLT